MISICPALRQLPPAPPVSILVVTMLLQSMHVLVHEYAKKSSLTHA